MSRIGRRAIFERLAAPINGVALVRLVVVAVARGQQGDSNNRRSKRNPETTTGSGIDRSRPRPNVTETLRAQLKSTIRKATIAGERQEEREGVCVSPTIFSSARAVCSDLNDVTSSRQLARSGCRHGLAERPDRHDAQKEDPGLDGHHRGEAPGCRDPRW